METERSKLEAYQKLLLYCTLFIKFELLLSDA